MPVAPATDLQLATTKHRYRDPRNGRVATSITSIVGNLDLGDKLGAGAAAAVKLAKLGRNYRAEWNDKRDRGSRTHEYIDLWANGHSADVMEGDNFLLDAFEAFTRSAKPEWIQVERAVVSSCGFGGRFDLIGELSGVPWLLDVKTGKPYEVELLLQLAGYASCDGMIVFDETGKAVDLEPMPYIERWGGLYLNSEGAQLVEVPKPRTGALSLALDRLERQEAAKEAFLHLAWTRTWADSEKVTRARA